MVPFGWRCTLFSQHVSWCVISIFISYDAGSISLRYATHFGCIRGCFEGGCMLGECISLSHGHRAVSDGCSCTVEIRPMHEDVVVSPTSRLVNFPSSVCIGGCSLHNPPCIIDCMHGGLSTWCGLESSGEGYVIVLILQQGILDVVCGVGF